ncbi:MAG: hypothetical protein DMG93_15785 [Acidobacteria bacterium]|nr:MAG: hypothetical protein DMG93_15785 [Acidobacteriota bacterium]
MKSLATISAVLLFLFGLASAPAFSQERDDRSAQTQDDRAKDKDKGPAKNDDKAMKQDENRAKQDEGKRDEARPGGSRNDNARPDTDQNNNSRPATARPQEENRREQRPEEHVDRDRQQHPMQAQRGKRIPDDRFRSSFGRQHHFHVDRTRIVNVSQPIVVYGGYQFQLVDAWPADWSYDDDCYIDYVDDGYYLFDVMHPGMRIAVFVIE